MAKIDYNEILTIIRNEIVEIVNEDEEYYDGLNILIDNEKQFIKRNSNILDQSVANQNTIFIVVKFSSSSVNLGQTVLPITIVALSENNNIERCQTLLTDFAIKYNYKRVGDIFQYYTSPSVSSNFEYTYIGFRSTYSMSGTFLITNEVLYETVEYYNDGEVDAEELEIITFNYNFNNQLNTQPFFDKDGLTKSVAQYGTFSFTISSYALAKPVFLKALKLMVRSEDENHNLEQDINNNFHFKIIFGNRQVTMDRNFKLSACSGVRELGQIPIMSCTFTL